MSFRIPALALVVLLASSGCATALGAAPSDTIAVNGQGSVTVVPDMAIAHVGAEARAPQLTDAIAETAQRMARVLERVRALGISDKDITTARYSIDPIPAPRRTESDPVRIDGYRVTNMVQLRIRDIKMVAPVLDGVVAAGANLMFGLTFALNDPSPVEAQARALAVRDAATRARHFADAAGVRLGDLLRLSEKSTGAGAPFVRAGLMGAVPVPIEPGTLEISSVVEALYRFSRKRRPLSSARRPASRRRARRATGCRT